MASYTPDSRGYAWALQTDYLTGEAVSAGNLKEIICMDENFIDFEPQTADDQAWSHAGTDALTDQWIETQNVRVSHTMPGFAQQLGELFYINGQYAVATPVGGTLSRDHTFKPTDPTVTRQDKAVTYAETAGAGHGPLVRSMVSDGWVLKGSGKGVLTADFNLLGAGHVNFSPSVTWYPTSTPTVTRRTAQHKLFNSQIGLVVTDAGSPTTYGCRYRSFEFAYRKTMLDEAGMSPGCGLFLSASDPTSGMLRGSHEFGQQALDFTINVDMASGSAEALAVQQQKPLVIALTATGGIIEGAIPYKMILTVPVAKYKTSKPVVSDGIMQFAISGKALFDFATSKLFDIVLTNNVTTYATSF